MQSGLNKPYGLMSTYRKEKVASVVQQIVSEAISHRLNDPRVAPLTTVTRVVVTGDLLVARIYLSVQGDDVVERRTLTGIRRATGFLQRMVARELCIRQCPELRFEIDAGVKGARRTLELLAENRRREPEVYVDDAEQGTADDKDGERSEDSVSDDCPDSSGTGE